jgi:hypothetical protein
VCVGAGIREGWPEKPDFEVDGRNPAGKEGVQGAGVEDAWGVRDLPRGDGSSLKNLPFGSS